MVLLGLLMALLGFLITLAGLGFSASTGARMAIAMLGIAVSLGGILGVINKAYLKNAIWRN